MTDTPSTQQLTASEPKLADAELVILSSAANRADRIAIPVPATLSGKPDHVQSALKRLLRRKLLEEHPAKLEDGLWRKDAEDRHLTLRITPAGYDAIKVEMPVDLEPARLSADKATNKPTQNRQKPAARRKLKSRPPSRGVKSRHEKVGKRPVKRDRVSKAESVVALLGRTSGASLNEIIKVTGWQPHSVRGFLSGVVKKRLRLSLSASEDGRGVRRNRLKSHAKR